MIFDLNIAQIIVICVCSIGVGFFSWSLYKRDKCDFGGVHDWYDKEEFQFTTIKECKKCREQKGVEKIKI